MKFLINANAFNRCFYQQGGLTYFCHRSSKTAFVVSSEDVLKLRNILEKQQRHLFSTLFPVAFLSLLVTSFKLLSGPALNVCFLLVCVVSSISIFYIDYFTKKEIKKITDRLPAVDRGWHDPKKQLVIYISVLITVVCLASYIKKELVKVQRMPASAQKNIFDEK